MNIDGPEILGAHVTVTERQCIREAARRAADTFGIDCCMVNIGVGEGVTVECLRAGAPDAEILGIDIDPASARGDWALVRADSRRFHAEIDRPIHLLLIDGDHSYYGVKADILNWCPKVPAGGIVAFHDYANGEKAPWTAGVKQAIDELMIDEWTVIGVADSLRVFGREAQDVVLQEEPHRLVNRVNMPGDAKAIRAAVDIPGLWDEPGTVLYIGAHPWRFHVGPELFEHGHEITLLEIWKPNADAFRGFHMTPHVICGDVRDVNQMQLPHGQYDAVVWWHGPEHIAKDEIAPVLKELEYMARRVVVLASPWGRLPQAAINGNEAEAHACDLCPEDYAGWGYTAQKFGGPDDLHNGRLTAWKQKGE